MPRHIARNLVNVYIARYETVTSLQQMNTLKGQIPRNLNIKNIKQLDQFQLSHGIQVQFPEKSRNVNMPRIFVTLTNLRNLQQRNKLLQWIQINFPQWMQICGFPKHKAKCWLQNLKLPNIKTKRSIENLTTGSRKSNGLFHFNTYNVNNIQLAYTWILVVISQQNALYILA